MVVVVDFNLLFKEIFKHNNGARRVDVLTSTNGKARKIRVNILNFIDSSCFMSMSLDKVAILYGIKSKTLYPYEYFKDENSYNNILGNLSIEDFRSSLTKKWPLQAEDVEFNINNSKRTGKESTLEYMENDVRILEYCFISFVNLNLNTN